MAHFVFVFPKESVSRTFHLNLLSHLDAIRTSSILEAWEIPEDTTHLFQYNGNAIDLPASFRAHQIQIMIEASDTRSIAAIKNTNFFLIVVPEMRMVVEHFNKTATCIDIDFIFDRQCQSMEPLTYNPYLFEDFTMMVIGADDIVSVPSLGQYGRTITNVTATENEALDRGLEDISIAVSETSYGLNLLAKGLPCIFRNPDPKLSSLLQSLCPTALIYAEIDWLCPKNDVLIQKLIQISTQPAYFTAYWGIAAKIRVALEERNFFRTSVEKFMTAIEILGPYHTPTSISTPTPTPTSTSIPIPTPTSTSIPIPAPPASSSDSCVVCLDARQCVVFLPCKHLACCSACAPSMTTCPICRATITERMNIFPS